MFRFCYSWCLKPFFCYMCLAARSVGRHFSSFSGRRQRPLTSVTVLPVQCIILSIHICLGRPSTRIGSLRERSGFVALSQQLVLLIYHTNTCFVALSHQYMFCCFITPIHVLLLYEVYHNNTCFVALSHQYMFCCFITPIYVLLLYHTNTCFVALSYQIHVLLLYHTNTCFFFKFCFITTINVLLLYPNIKCIVLLFYHNNKCFVALSQQ